MFHYRNRMPARALRHWWNGRAIPAGRTTRAFRAMARAPLTRLTSSERSRAGRIFARRVARLDAATIRADRGY